MAGASHEREPRFSRDRAWIAYVADTTGRDEVYLRPYPGPGPVFPVSTEGGTEPVWSRAGNELFYRQGNRLMAVPVVTTPSLRVGQPAVLFEGSFQRQDLTAAPDYDVAADGRFIMVTTRPIESQSSQAGLTVVENWQTGTKS